MDIFQAVMIVISFGLGYVVGMLSVSVRTLHKMDITIAQYGRWALSTGQLSKKRRR